VPASTRRSLEDVIEDTCAAAQWRTWFADHRTPFVHPDAGAYAALARAAGFTVKGAGMAHEAWDFGSRPAFAHFAAGTFVAWTSRLPEDRRDAFIEDALDRYAAVQPPPPGAECVRLRSTGDRVQLEDNPITDFTIGRIS
jgi:hypothetical protein